MRRVIDILISTSLTIDSCSMLQTLVAEMNELYLRYSNSHLKPKFHFFNTLSLHDQKIWSCHKLLVHEI